MYVRTFDVLTRELLLNTDPTTHNVYVSDCILDDFLLSRLASMMIRGKRASLEISDIIICLLATVSAGADLGARRDGMTLTETR